jgi:hypothetical protein
MGCSEFQKIKLTMVFLQVGDGELDVIYHTNQGL